MNRLAFWRDMQGFEFDDGNAEIVRGFASECMADSGCARAGLVCDAGGKFRVGDGVHGDSDYACE